MKTGEKTAPFAIGADDTHQPRAAAERSHVVCGVAGAAGDDFGGIVLENQHRRFARDPFDVAVNELVRDQITDNEDAPAREAVHEPEQTLLALGVAGQRMNGSCDEHSSSVPYVVSAVRRTSVSN